MTPRTFSLEKAFALLAEVARGEGNQPLAELAERTSLPLSTAHRLASSLEALGLIVREKRGHYHVGPAVLELAQGVDVRGIMTRVSRPFLRDLARRFQRTVHLAVFETDMVTYLAKENVGRNSILTIEGTQLEAYCSGLGKVLLAHLPDRERERYLSEGPFVRLTPKTIIEPRELRDELARIRARGYAIDDGEVVPNLHCVAVPLSDWRGRVVAAMSTSSRSEDFSPDFVDQAVAELQAAADQISARLYPKPARAR